MKTLRKLPILLAFVATLFLASCSEDTIEPVNTEDDDTIIVIPPPSNP